ncbi:hypothetical protein [Saccharopolyspora phatthalungensis]|uniref:Uncharacterized protein n=1 Tax=Saccharopolyspora phatthalungensis TaxID=664693 RepID=A0A840QHF4_9PSEU|nr:hypothetical protein [Saccharopolyspora phatthalungensis]MBB5159597.1 hypothetical protein [Saccharopolyspora phatthalungensis]
MLTVVPEQQHLLVVEMGDERAHRIMCRTSEPNPFHDRHRDQSGIAELGEVDQPDTVGERAPPLPRHMYRKPRLANPAHTGQGHRSRGRQQTPDLGSLGTAPHQTRYLNRQIVHGDAATPAPQLVHCAPVRTFPALNRVRSARTK